MGQSSSRTEPTATTKPSGRRIKLFNDRSSWGWPARLLHWTTAGVILFMLGVGFYMTNFVDDLFARFALTQTHKSWGFVVFALALTRLGWRVVNRTSPPEPAGTKPWEALAARVSHAAFYGLMLLMPISGWLMASASPLQDTYGIKNRVFDWFVLPDPFIPGSQALESVFSTIHYGGALTLAALLVVHAGAAMKHHFIKKNDVLGRMTWGR
jgi:cytochrome b561